MALYYYFVVTCGSLLVLSCVCVRVEVEQCSAHIRTSPCDTCNYNLTIAIHNYRKGRDLGRRALLGGANFQATGARLRRRLWTFGLGDRSWFTHVAIVAHSVPQLPSNASVRPSEMMSDNGYLRTVYLSLEYVQRHQLQGPPKLSGT